MRMNNLGIVTRNIQRADPPTVARLSRFGVAIIYNLRGLLAAAGLKYTD